MLEQKPDQRPQRSDAPQESTSARTVVLMASVGVALLVLLLLLWPHSRGGGGPGGAGTGGFGTGQGIGQSDGEGADPYAGRRRSDDATSGPGSAGAGEGPGATAAGAAPAPAGPTAEAATPEGPDAQSDGEEDSQPPAPPVAPDEELTLATPPTAEEVSKSRPRAPYDARSQRGARSAAARQGMTADSEAAVDRGLRWLARKQLPTSEWAGAHPTGVAGLAVLAFLGAGHTHRQRGPFQANVERALRWLLSQEAQDGSFRRLTFYEQGIATMAISEAYGMTQDASLKRPAEVALGYVLRNMGPDGGYGYGGAGDDVHVTSFQVMALKSGHLAGFPIPAEAVQRLRQYYAKALAPDGTTGYRADDAVGIEGLVLPGLGGNPASTRTAVGLFCRVFLDCDLKGPDVRLIAEVLHEVGPQLSNVFQVYDGTYAMYQLGGDYWKEWNRRFRDGVIALQVRGGEEDGSWPGGNGGTVCNTAMYVMSLEVYYRYLPVNIRGAGNAREKGP